MKKLSTLLIFLCFINISFSQSHINGIVTLDIEKGYIHCEFTLTNLPKLKNYQILLNHGMNIKYFKDAEGKHITYDGYSNGKTNGEGLEYYFVNDKDEKIDLKNSFKIEYSGAFPVYDDSFNDFDFKGYIAINDKTLRATEQTKWYPILYDEENDKLLDNYTYEITVITTKSESVFINGAVPKKGIKTILSSTNSVPLFLFAGDYDFINVDGNYLINTDVTKEVSTKIFDNIDDIKKYYENLFSIDFKDKIYLINHTAVKDLKDGDWGFNTYPSFGFSNLNFSDLLTKEDKFKAHRYKFFAHEFAHNYFGNNVNSGSLSWFWIEGTAEYLSLFALEDFTNSKNVDGYYEYYLSAIQEKEFVPLANVTESNQIYYEYRYLLAPLIYKVFEISYGKKKTIETLKSLLELSKTQTLTIKSWEQSAIKNGITKMSFENFKNTFLVSQKFKQNITDLIRKTTANKVHEK